jgi:tetratricopeptide (TPR) repeat protein
LIIGEIDAAIETISQAIRLNNKVPEVRKLLNPVSQYYVIGQRLTKGHALYLAGRTSEARQSFLVESADPEFQAVQAQSEEGSWYIDLLLQDGQWDAVEKLINAKISNPTALIEFVYTNFASARSSLGLALSTCVPLKSSVSDVSFRMTECIEGLRKAAITEQIALGLLARSVFRRSVGDWDGVVRDLDEVEEIAAFGPMKLHLCDMALERARLAFARVEAFAPLNGLIDDNPPKPVVPDVAEVTNLNGEARKQLVIAAAYIKTCGYHRRDEELAELEAVLRGERKFADLPPRV